MPPPGNRADPSPSFRFHVIVGDTGIARFSEVGGLNFEQTPEEYAEGGVNSHVHRFPSRFKWGDLTLKKGIATDGQAIWDWFQEAVQFANSGKSTPKPVTVTLKDLTGTIDLRTWTFNRAFPIKWSIAALSAEQNVIAFETLTLAHQGIAFSE
jgi:phage tail-like protein